MQTNFTLQPPTQQTHIVPPQHTTGFSTDHSLVRPSATTIVPIASSILLLQTPYIYNAIFRGSCYTTIFRIIGQ